MCPGCHTVLLPHPFVLADEILLQEELSKTTYAEFTITEDTGTEWNFRRSVGTHLLVEPHGIAEAVGFGIINSTTLKLVP